MTDSKTPGEFFKSRPDPKALAAFIKNVSAPMPCSFCGLPEGNLAHHQKPGGRTVRVVQGPAVAICDACVELCQKVLNQRAKPAESPE
jgi:hypothetical protein